MWTRYFLKVGQLVARGFVRWMEMLGQNPPLSRDHGLHAWRYLHAQRQQRQVRLLPPDPEQVPMPCAPVRPAPRLSVIDGGVRQNPALLQQIKQPPRASL